MKPFIKIFLMFIIVCSANVMCAQTSDTSDASNSDNSNKVRHGGAPGSTASYTVHDGEVRPVEKGKVKGSNGNSGETQTANGPSSNMTGQGANADSNSANNVAAPPTNEASTDAKSNSNCHFCWGWLGLLGLLGLGGLIKRNREKA